MAKLAWGKPKIQYRLANSTGAWSDFPTPVENTTKLTTAKGTKLEAKLEGGGFEDVKYQKNTYTFEFELYAGENFTRPIDDNDGIIELDYSLRLIPENPAVPGIVIDKCSMSVEETFDTQVGSKLKYTADVLVPDNGSRQVKWQVITVAGND